MWSRLALILALCLLVSATPVTARQESSPVASPEAGLPETAVGAQLAWVMAQLQGEASSLTEADVEAHFAPEFLALFLPAPVVVDVLRQTAQEFAPITFAGFAFPPSEIGAVALIDANVPELERQAALYLVVEPIAPHRITRLEFGEAPMPASATGKRVSIGDRALYLDCVGDGAPTVVLEGGISSDWSAVQPDIARTTRICSYDRPDSPGSRSDPVDTRDGQQVVDDLHALLAAANEPGPYVLVGHSMGGLYVQLYAYQHPEQVAGLVLVDPTPEDFAARLAEIYEQIGVSVPEPEPGAPVPPDQRTFDQVREARRSGTLPQVPVIVITHGHPDDPESRPPGWPIDQEEQAFRELHEELVRLIPGARHVIARQSGHNIHLEQPEIVNQAILDVVGAVRDPASWATPAA